MVEAFSDELLDTSDDQNSGKPITVTDNFHTEKVNELLNKDR